jgi:large subunit ribosomal protein L24
MANAMKVKKGDLVHILSGKDRGKQGRVVEARPREGRVLVENLNLVRRHTRPRPMRDANRMGGTQIIPVVCPVCNTPTRVGMQVKETKGEQVTVRVCKREGCGQEIDR